MSPAAQLDLLQRRLASKRALLAAATTMSDEQIVGLHAVFCATQRPRPLPGVSPSTRFASLTRAALSAANSSNSSALGSPASASASSSSSSLSSSSSASASASPASFSATSAFDLSRALGAVMNYDEFCRALAFSPTSILARQIFDLVDSRHRVGALSFVQFALCVAILSGHCREHSLARFTFDVYDLNKDGYIDFGELKAMLENSLADRGIAFVEADINAMCASTLLMLDPERGTHIAFARYEQVCDVLGP